MRQGTYFGICQECEMNSESQDPATHFALYPGPIPKVKKVASRLKQLGIVRIFECKHISKPGLYGSQTCPPVSTCEDWHIFGCPLNVDIHLFTTFSLILSLETGSVDIVALSTIGHESNVKFQRGPVNGQVIGYPMVMTNIAIENGHRNSGFSH